MALIVLDRVTSTMDVARAMLRLRQVVFDERARPEPSGVMALEQTEGRGQRGRTWYSAKGEGLYVTYYVPLTRDQAREAGKLSILAGAALAEALQQMCLAVATERFRTHADSHLVSNLVPGLKWPNDLVIGDKKLGGVLVEVISDYQDGLMALVGVGLNVFTRTFPPSIDATSLLIEGYAPPSLHATAVYILESLFRRLHIQDMNGFSETLQAWRRFDKTSGRRYRADLPDGVQTGTAVNIDADGALLLRFADNSVRTVWTATAVTEMQTAISLPQGNERSY